MRIWAALLLALLFCTPAAADELRPAYVELNETAQGSWSVTWKASERSLLGQRGRVIIPDNCAREDEESRRFANGNILRSFTMRCDSEISGGKIGLEQLELSSTDALVRIAPLGGEMQTLRLTPASPSARIGDDGGTEISNVAVTYTIIGIEHIVFGFDHLLFVVGLVLLLKGGWLVVQTVTAFTVAHSITLIGTTLGYLSLPSRPVEAIIALSIIFLALEIVKSKPGELRLSERFPWVVAFLFGLLHGFGFAGALAEIGLPQGDVPLALLTFNLGVEIGQLVIVAAALALLAVLRKYREQLLIPVKTGSAYAIGIIATYWFIERMVA